MTHFTRRRFLEIAGLAAGGMALRTGVWPSEARAQAAPDGLLLVCYFAGGWDQLLALDPRDHTDPRFAGSAPYERTGTGIHPAYDQVTDAEVRQVLTTTPSGVQRAGNLSFGPAVTPSLMAHSADLALLRGVNMGTLTHEVGRRYFLTGKFPRGLSASGSSVSTVVAAAAGEAKDIPNLAIQTEGYNQGLAAYASPIQVNGYTDVLAVLRPDGTQLPAASAQLLADYQAVACEGAQLDGPQAQASLYRASRQRARTMVQSGGYSLFDFGKSPPVPEVADLFTAMAMTSADASGVKGRAALAGQALARGYAQAVSVTLSSGLDDHDDWGVNHATELRVGLDALGRLISFLKAAEYQGTGTSVWSRTTLLVFSEFARTPLLNSRDGRDHHLCSSCMVAGPGIRGDVVVGASSDVKMAAQAIDPATGLVSDAGTGGVPLRPADIHATLLQSMGVGHSHLDNQGARIITALLR
ncbi:MAG: DUF1501 domain-containing protein [Myxococcaceae bacterium]|nr:DUF1501 domain-containing protein [Myxococcaceae bacterium]MCI0673851.1 DUF1501 domain-containing protein [Myxococcaceae bacterium]